LLLSVSGFGFPDHFRHSGRLDFGDPLDDALVYREASALLRMSLLTGMSSCNLASIYSRARVASIQDERDLTFPDRGSQSPHCNSDCTSLISHYFEGITVVGYSAGFYAIRFPSSEREGCREIFPVCLQSPMMSVCRQSPKTKPLLRCLLIVVTNRALLIFDFARSIARPLNFGLVRP